MKFSTAGAEDWDRNLSLLFTNLAEKLIGYAVLRVTFSFSTYLPLFALSDSVFAQQVGAQVFFHHEGPSAKQPEETWLIRGNQQAIETINIQNKFII